MNSTLFSRLRTRQEIVERVLQDKNPLRNIVLIQDKILLLDVELGIFANEIILLRDPNQKVNRDKAILMYANCLQLFISIANDLNIVGEYHDEFDDNDIESFKAMYLRCKKHLIDLPSSISMHTTYKMAFAWFWAMSRNVGFSENEILENISMGWQ